MEPPVHFFFFEGTYFPIWGFRLCTLPWDPRDVSRMFLDDFFGLLGSKKGENFPDPKNFLFWPFGRDHRRQVKIGLWRPKMALWPVYALATSFSTPWMGLNRFFMRFSESRDDFRWNMHFYGIFWRFMVSEGSPRENPPKDPKNDPQNGIFP